MSDLIRYRIAGYDAGVQPDANGGLCRYHEVKNKIERLTADLEVERVQRAFERRKLEAEVERLRADLHRLLFTVDGDHMTACDRVMGDSHPCTCGAAEMRIRYG